MKMADLDNLPTWFLKNLDGLILEYQEDIGDRPKTLNDLEKWYRNKHGTTKRKLKEKEIRVVKKPVKTEPLVPEWDWRLAPWQDYPEDDDVPQKSARHPFIKTTDRYAKLLKALETKPDPDLDKGLGYLLGTKDGH